MRSARSSSIGVYGVLARSERRAYPHVRRTDAERVSIKPRCVRRCTLRRRSSPASSSPSSSSPSPRPRWAGAGDRAACVQKRGPNVDELDTLSGERTGRRGAAHHARDRGGLAISGFGMETHGCCRMRPPVFSSILLRQPVAPSQAATGSHRGSLTVAFVRRLVIADVQNAIGRRAIPGVAQLGMVDTPRRHPNPPNARSSTRSRWSCSSASRSSPRLVWCTD